MIYFVVCCLLFCDCVAIFPVFKALSENPLSFVYMGSTAFIVDTGSYQRARGVFVVEEFTVAVAENDGKGGQDYSTSNDVQKKTVEWDAIIKNEDPSSKIDNSGSVNTGALDHISNLEKTDSLKPLDIFTKSTNDTYVFEYPVGPVDMVSLFAILSEDKNIAPKRQTSPKPKLQTRPLGEIVNHLPLVPFVDRARPAPKVDDMLKGGLILLLSQIATTYFRKERRALALQEKREEQERIDREMSYSVKLLLAILNGF